MLIHPAVVFSIHPQTGVMAAAAGKFLVELGHMAINYLKAHELIAGMGIGFSAGAWMQWHRMSVAYDFLEKAYAKQGDLVKRLLKVIEDTQHVMRLEDLHPSKMGKTGGPHSHKKAAFGLKKRLVGFYRWKGQPRSAPVNAI